MCAWLFQYVCLIVSICLQVMYDASGVRLHAGRQAGVSCSWYEPWLLLLYCTCRDIPFIIIIFFLVMLYVIVVWLPSQLLNQIVCELPPEHPLSNIRPLRDSLGHTPLQVHFQSCDVIFVSSVSLVYICLWGVHDSFKILSLIGRRCLTQCIMLYAIYWTFF